MYRVVFFTRLLKKFQFVGRRGGFPYVRCFTDIDYEVHTDSGQVLTSMQAWGNHPAETNLLAYYVAAQEGDWFSFELRPTEKPKKKKSPKSA